MIYFISKNKPKHAFSLLFVEIIKFLVVPLVSPGGNCFCINKSTVNLSRARQIRRGTLPFTCDVDEKKLSQRERPRLFNKPSSITKGAKIF